MKSGTSGNSKRDREFAVQQLIDRAVVSTDIVDILKVAGMDTPELSILSDEFLAEVKDSKRPNLALEALKSCSTIGSTYARRRTQSRAESIPSGWAMPSRAITPTRSARWK